MAINKDDLLRKVKDDIKKGLVKPEQIQPNLLAEINTIDVKTKPLQPTNISSNTPPVDPERTIGQGLLAANIAQDIGLHELGKIVQNEGPEGVERLALEKANLAALAVGQNPGDAQIDGSSRRFLEQLVVGLTGIRPEDNPDADSLGEKVSGFAGRATGEALGFLPFGKGFKALGPVGKGTREVLKAGGKNALAEGTFQTAKLGVGEVTGTDNRSSEDKIADVVLGATLVGGGDVLARSIFRSLPQEAQDKILSVFGLNKKPASEVVDQKESSLLDTITQKQEPEVILKSENPIPKEKPKPKPVDPFKSAVDINKQREIKTRINQPKTNLSKEQQGFVSAVGKKDTEKVNQHAFKSAISPKGREVNGVTVEDFGAMQSIAPSLSLKDAVKTTKTISKESEVSVIDAVIKSSDRRKDAAKTANANFSESVISLPEVVRLSRELLDGKFPEVKKLVGRALRVNGQFNSGKETIKLNKNIFKDPKQAAKTLSHEIGHVVDWLPDKDLSRGNLLGRVKSLKKNMKQTFDGLKEKEIRKELFDLSRKWRPFNPDTASISFLRYRKSSPELYADAISVLINDPRMLNTHAPKFAEAFFNNLNKKPAVRKAYLEMLENLNSGKDIKLLYDDIVGGFRAGEEAYAKRMFQETSESISERLKIEFVDFMEPVLKRVRAVEKSGEKIVDNPRYKLEQQLYEGSELEHHLRGFAKTVFDPIKESKINFEDLGVIAFARRVVSDRSELANAFGTDPDSAIRLLAEAKNRLGAKKYKKAIEISDNFATYRKDIISKIENSKMFDADTMARLRDNENYVTFDVVDHIDGKFGSGQGRILFEQVGSLKEIGDPITATVLKDLSIIRSVNRNNSIKSTVNFLKDYFPEEIKPAELSFNGKIRAPIPPKDKSQKLITMLNGNKLEGFYVPKNIGSVFDSGDHVLGGALGEYLSKANTPFRELFINKNVGFWAFNIFRDFQSAVENLPKANIKNFLPKYISSIKPAFRSAFRVPDDVVDSMLKRGELISIASKDGLVETDKQLERMLKQFSIKPKDYKNQIIAPIVDFMDNMDKTARALERIPKIAGRKHLEAVHPNLSEEEISSMVRTLAGSPSFLRRGRQYQWYNNIFMFSNAIKEGYRANLEGFGRGRVGFASKVFAHTMIPKILVMGASAGYFGKEMKDLMLRIPEYDKANYNIVPIGLAKDGDAIYFRFPTSEFGRLVGGVAHKAFSKEEEGIGNTVQSIFQYTGGQLPSLSPTYGLLSDVSQMAMGLNPFDEFRGDFMIPRQIFEADDARKWQVFAKKMANNMGAGIVKRFDVRSEKEIATELDELLNYPVSQNIIGRFIKKTSRGIDERLRRVDQKIERDAARESLDIKESVNRLIEGKQLSNDEILLLLQNKRKAENAIEKMLAAKSDSRIQKILARKGISNKKKDAILRELIKLMLDDGD